MHSLWTLFLLLAAPFWESKPPQQWSNLDLDLMFRNSPWAQTALLTTRIGGEPQVFVYLASAKPMQEAEKERDSRGHPKSDPVAEEYRIWAADNLSKYIVLAVHVPVSFTFTDEGESKRMEKETGMRVGRKRYAPVLHFLPSSTDAHLRFVFPREVPDSAKKLNFEFYVPSISGPYREAEFPLKDLVYKGAPSY
ncbi:MAG: hypothetical protein ABJF23_21735 [Bryobacteraceae bacterium]